MSDMRMPDLNAVTIAGRLTRDPELRVLPTGTPVCTLGLAVSRKFKTKDGESREEVLFINVTCWGKTAEFVGENFHKGHPMIITGRLKMDEWDDKTTGAKRTAIAINAERVQCLEWHGNTRGKKQEAEAEPASVDGDGIPF